MRLKISLVTLAIFILSCFVYNSLVTADEEANPDDVIVLSEAIREALPDVFGETGFAAAGAFGLPLGGEPTIPGSVSGLSNDISLPPYAGTTVGGGTPPPPPPGPTPIVPTPTTPPSSGGPVVATPIVLPGAVDAAE